MKRCFVSVFLLSMAVSVFAQPKKTLTIMPGMMAGVNYDYAKQSRDEYIQGGRQGDGAEYDEVLNQYFAMISPLQKEISSSLIDCDFVAYDDENPKTTDFTVNVSVRKSDGDSNFVYEATLYEQSVLKSGPAKVSSAGNETKEIAKQLATKLCPLPVPGTISLFRVDGEATVFWSEANTDVKNDTLEYMMLRSPSKTNLTNKNTAIRLARQETREWKAVASGGYFEENVDLENEPTKLYYFTVVVRNSLGCYSVYDVKGCQRITVSTYLPGTVLLSTSDSRGEEREYDVGIGLEEKKNIMLSDGSWKISVNYDDGFESDEKSIEVLSNKTGKNEISFDDVNEEFIQSKYNQGMALKAKRRTDDAIKSLTLAADNETYPHTEAMYQLGVIYEEKKDFQKALAYYKKASENGNGSARERLIAWHQNIVDGYEIKTTKDESYLDSLYELKDLLAGSGETKRINDINNKIKIYEENAAKDKRDLAKSLADTKKSDSDYIDNLKEAYDIYYYELGDYKKASDVEKKIKDYEAEVEENEIKKLKDQAKKLKNTSKNDPDYVDNLEEASSIYYVKLDDEEESEKIDKMIEDYKKKQREKEEKEEKLRDTQRHRTIITPLAFGFGGTLLTEKDDPSLPSPYATLNISINGTFGIWPNVFVGFSTVFDIYNSPNSSYYDYFGTSILGTIGFNYTIWHHINLFVLVGGGCEFLNENISSHEVWDENSHSYHYYQSEENKYVNSRLRAGIGFDWWFVYDDDDDWVFLDKIGMTFEYDLDYYFDSSQRHGNRLDGTFKLGFTFFWDTEGTAGFMPSFYNY